MKNNKETVYNSIEKPARTMLNTYATSFPINITAAKGEKLGKHNAYFVFTSGAVTETMSITVEGLTWSFPFEPVQLLLDKTRAAREKEAR